MLGMVYYYWFGEFSKNSNWIYAKTSILYSRLIHGTHAVFVETAVFSSVELFGFRFLMFLHSKMITFFMDQPYTIIIIINSMLNHSHCTHSLILMLMVVVGFKYVMITINSVQTLLYFPRKKNFASSIQF